MAEFPYLPLWTDAYLADTIHLSATEHGAYLMLLMSMWRSKDQKLPDDDKLLARYARLTPGQWRRIRPLIITFFSIENGELSNKRLTKEYDVVKRLTRQRSDAGKASALKRKETGSTSVQRNANEKQAPIPTLRVEDEVSSTKSAPVKKTGPTVCKKDFKPDQPTIDILIADGKTPQQIDAAVVEMIDWSQAGSKRKHDWNATLRNWVRRNMNGNGTHKSHEYKSPASIRKAEMDAAIEKSRRNLVWEPDSPSSPEPISPMLLAQDGKPKTI